MAWIQILQEDKHDKKKPPFRAVNTVIKDNYGTNTIDLTPGPSPSLRGELPKLHRGFLADIISVL